MGLRHDDGHRSGDGGRDGRAGRGRGRSSRRLGTPYYEAILCQVVVGRTKKVSRADVENQACARDVCGGRDDHLSHTTDSQYEVVVPATTAAGERDGDADARVLPRFVVRFEKKKVEELEQDR